MIQKCITSTELVLGDIMQRAAAANARCGFMGGTTGAVWNARANNPYYRISELTLPALTSTGLQRFESKTTFLPHTAGHLLVKSQGQERDTQIVAGRPIEFESGTESEIVNTTDQALSFTVTEFK